MDSVKLIIREAINTLECLKMAKEVASEIWYSVKNMDLLVKK
jgi:hypothetical protein